MAENTNRKDGLRFETELCEAFANHGWWAHDMTQSTAGQPADVIAVRLNTAVLIDCKVCSGNKFKISRVEGNQDSAMTLWGQRGNGYAYFAMKMADGSVYMIPYDEITFLRREGVVLVPEVKIRKFMSFEEWITKMEDLI